MEPVWFTPLDEYFFCFTLLVQTAEGGIVVAPQPAPYSMGVAEKLPYAGSLAPAWANS
jgi:hypothetical protein